MEKKTGGINFFFEKFLEKRSKFKKKIGGIYIFFCTIPDFLKIIKKYWVSIFFWSNSRFWQKFEKSGVSKSKGNSFIFATFVRKYMRYRHFICADKQTDIICADKQIDIICGNKQTDKIQTRLCSESKPLDNLRLPRDTHNKWHIYYTFTSHIKYTYTFHTTH